MQIKPLHDRVLLKIAPEETKTKSGLIIPDTAQEKTHTGEVVAVGTSDEINVKKGQKVLYEKYAGSQIEVDKVEHLVIQAKDILAIIE